MLKIVQNPLLQTWDGYMVEVLDGALVKQNHSFFLDFQRSEFVCFWSVSRELVKELMGVTRHLI